jgi:hypothetical protein
MALEDFYSALSSADSVTVYQQIASYIGISLGVLYIILAVIAIWSFIWKGFALWKSARKNHMIWFIVLLIVNTAGILEILYIYIFSKTGKKSSSEEKLDKSPQKSVAVKKKKR